jgi:hypothetical protein
MANVQASFEVFASTTTETELDVDGLTPDQIAALLENEGAGVSLCHQCDDEVSDPEVGELVAFYIDDKAYNRVDGKWVES